MQDAVKTGTLGRLVAHAVVLVASAGTMIVELVASRLVSKYLGSSLYTWTSVIGIVLGGISLGNWLGGRMADRHSPRRLIPWILLGASALTVLIVVLDAVVGRLVRVLPNDVMSMGILVRSVVLITVMFFLPSTALGMVSPVMARYAIEGARGPGRAVGGIYAVGSLGSIGGTFLAGYLLIPAIGLTANVLAVAAALALLALALGGRRLVTGAWAAVIVAAWATGAPGALAGVLAGEPPGVRVLETRDSPYSWIQVSDRSTPAGVERTLRLDALIHNRYDFASPDHLLYEYERIFAALTRVAARALAHTPALATLTLGGGAFTLPEYLERHYPAGSHEVAEIDPGVVEVAHRYFDLPRDTRLAISIEDARVFVDRVQGRRRYDVVYCDAFNAYAVPYHLTTKEFLQRIAAVMSPDGLYLVNLIDIFDSGSFLAAFLDTARTVFPDVAVYVPPDSGSSTRTTFVVAAGRRDAGLDDLRDETGALVGTRISAERLAELAARNGRVVLTDDHAPVENLIGPVFLRSVE